MLSLEVEPGQEYFLHSGIVPGGLSWLGFVRMRQGRREFERTLDQH